MSATIKDIARETGLALATISKYINGGTVRPQNKKQIDPETELRSTKHGPGTSFLQDLPYRSGIRSSQYSA